MGQSSLTGTPVALPPTISSFTPSGKIGATITINGTNFGVNTTVQFNGVYSGTVSVSSPTSLTTVVPVGASTGKLTVTTPGGSVVSSTDFTVLPNTLTVQFTGDGSGTISATLPDTQFSCSDQTAPCSVNVAYNTPVTVTRETTAVGSVFDGWTGCDSISGESCSIVVLGDRTVGVVFNILRYLQNQTTSVYYGTMHGALDAATNGQSVKAVNIQLPDIGYTFNTGAINVTLKGGYDILTDPTPAGFTSVTGPFIVRSGTLVLDRLVIK